MGRLGNGGGASLVLLDEDDLVSDSAVAVASQQSLKAFIEGLAPAYKVGTFSKNSADASGDQVVSGLGFTPGPVLFLMCANAAGKTSVGFDDGTSRQVSAQEPTGGWNAALTAIHDIHTAGGSNLMSAVVSARAAGQFTLTWTKTGSPTGTLYVVYLAIKA